MAFFTFDGAGNATGGSISILPTATATVLTLTFSDTANRNMFLAQLPERGGIANNSTITVPADFVFTGGGSTFRINSGNQIRVTSATAITVTYPATGQTLAESVDGTIPTQQTAFSLRNVGLRTGANFLVFNGSDSTVSFEGNFGQLTGHTGIIEIGIRRQAGKTSNRDSVNGGAMIIDGADRIRIGPREAIILEVTGTGTDSFDFGVANTQTAHGTVAQNGERLYFASI